MMFWSDLLRTEPLTQRRAGQKPTSFAKTSVPENPKSREAEKSQEASFHKTRGTRRRLVFWTKAKRSKRQRPRLAWGQRPLDWLRSRSKPDGRLKKGLTHSSLSKTAQEKLEAFKHAYQKQLDAQFDRRVQDEIKKAIDASVLPSWNESKERHDLIVASRKGIMSKATYKKILACLHSDRAASKELLNWAFNVFKQLEIVLINEAELATASRTTSENLERNPRTGGRKGQGPTHGPRSRGAVSRERKYALTTGVQPEVTLLLCNA